eukprot:scaffold2262_cov312-Prasinococcus_capsulatus_cf.AAC.8
MFMLLLPLLLLSATSSSSARRAAPRVCDAAASSSARSSARSAAAMPGSARRLRDAQGVRTVALARWPLSICAAPCGRRLRATGPAAPSAPAPTAATAGAQRVRCNAHARAHAQVVGGCDVPVAVVAAARGAATAPSPSSELPRPGSRPNRGRARPRESVPTGMCANLHGFFVPPCAGPGGDGAAARERLADGAKRVHVGIAFYNGDTQARPRSAPARRRTWGAFSAARGRGRGASGAPRMAWYDMSPHLCLAGTGPLASCQPPIDR